ncbi:unnamed protein product [Moneuplotes crassus]|uniref:Uncharacterized protein n=1 Tax=Euplotes crassus TaxID=5936 RepID=A0AAD1XG48_EUPCR|nr:unnamed protein product [Moneuplotes crassus]
MQNGVDQCQEMLPLINKDRMLKAKVGSDSQLKLRTSTGKLRYLFETNLEGTGASEDLILKERQKVFMRVHKIIKQKLSSGSFRHSRGLRSPRKLRRVLRSPIFRTKEVQRNLPELECKKNRRFFSPQRKAPSELVHPMA